MENRITVAEVKAAYQSTGIKPQFGMYLTCNPNETCGCPALVVAVARSGKSLEELRAVMDFNAIDLVDETLPAFYSSGFVTAVDGRPDYSRYHEGANRDEYEYGYEDGQAVRQAIFPGFPHVKAVT